jgi:hypothetical protein
VWFVEIATSSKTLRTNAIRFSSYCFQKKPHSDFASGSLSDGISIVWFDIGFEKMQMLFESENPIA